MSKTNDRSPETPDLIQLRPIVSRNKINKKQRGAQSETTRRRRRIAVVSEKIKNRRDGGRIKTIKLRTSVYLLPCRYEDNTQDFEIHLRIKIRR